MRIATPGTSRSTSRIGRARFGSECVVGDRHLADAERGDALLSLVESVLVLLTAARHGDLYAFAVVTLPPIGIHV